MSRDRPSLLATRLLVFNWDFLMGKPELGTKCTCTGCHQRFYDLNRTPAVCPKCGAAQPPEKARAPRPARSSFGIGSQPRRAAAVATIDDEVEAAEIPDAETEDDVPEADEDADDDVEIDAGHVEPAA
jgi:uncharacterized protein (TIGR02300 family)